MIITISGNLGSGKSTVAKIVAHRLGMKHYSAGDFMRAMADEKKVTLLELSKLAEQSNEIDNEIDNRTKKMGEEEDNFIIDSRLAFYFIAHSFKIFLGASYKVAAQRIFKAKRSDEKSNTSLEVTFENIKVRETSEEKRYKKIYGVSYFDKKHYDLVLNTDNLDVQQVSDKLIEAINLRKKQADSQKKQ